MANTDENTHVDPFEGGTVTIAIGGQAFLRYTRPEERLHLLRSATRVEVDGNMVKDRHPPATLPTADLERLRSSLAKRLAEVDAVLRGR
jgi:hypothetical protein